MQSPTYDLRGQFHSDEDLTSHQHAMQHDLSDEEHSVLEDDSDGEDRDDYMDDDDGSSSLSIPNESIDFDLVYALHSFAATVEGQANVVKGDSLVLMDDSNSYWWLVRVLKTQEVGYIPAENIETPFERLARLNKHRNVDLAAATQAELQETRDRLRDNLSSRAGSNQATPSPTPGNPSNRAGSRARSRGLRGVAFTPSLHVHRYPPAVWNEEDEDDDDVEWDDEPYEDEDPELAEEQEREREMAQGGALVGMEPDDGMSWEDGAVQDAQARQPVDAAGSQEQIGLHRPPQIQIESAQQLSPTKSSPQKESPQAQRQAFADRVQIIPDTTPSPTGAKTMDPMQASETRKISITPAVAREKPVDEPVQQLQQQGPLLPSAIMQQQQEERKRTREEIEALEEAARKKAKGRTSTEQGKPAGGAKLRKERAPEPVSSADDDSTKKKKGGGVFGGLFGRRKDKGKEKGMSSSISESGSTGSTEIIVGRDSEESGRSSQQHTGLTSAEISPVTASAKQQQQMLQRGDPSKAIGQSPQRPAQQGQPPDTPPGQTSLSQHASQLRQRDQQQQALYQQYLNRSPSSPPQTQPSYGLQSSGFAPGGSFPNSPSSNSGLGVGTSRPRPGSLVLSPQTMEGVGLPDLNVVRIFAGHNLQTEATFKTVLLNSGTTASDLVRQAIQRFRLSVGENEKDYYLTIKQVEGSSAALLPHEHPLVVFESLVEAAMELPKVKRSSVGSISSVSSNLSMHPAIKKLSMNDFTDDSAVKFYLNRRIEGRRDATIEEEGDETLMAESTFDEDPDTPRSPNFLNNNVTPDRFSSPSYKFALQLVIHPEDLPDDMVFDPLTEAIVFKNTLRDRSPHTSPHMSTQQHQRKKIFVLPKNVTVAEVIEMGLDRFGIIDGVVDGGDEVEDKLAKRRSSTRVRYGLTVNANGKERELTPSSRVIDAYPRPPQYRSFDRRVDSKRRSVDSAQLLGSAEDIGPDDPVFILRRAISYRPSSRRISAPLDEIALQRAQRESMNSSSTASDSTAGPDDSSKRQMSKQEVIAAQRAASRANQRAILSAQANSASGLDVLLPGNAMIRSSRYEVGDRMRYSYVEPDGETYDISDIVESEWRGEAGPYRERSDGARDDLLHGVLSRGKDGLGARLDRVLSKVRHEKSAGRAQPQQPSSAQSEQNEKSESIRSKSPSLYSTADGGTDAPNSRSATPNAHALNARSPTPTQRVNKPEIEPRSRSRQKAHERHQSISSVGSDVSGSGYVTAASPAGGRATAQDAPKPVYLSKDDFGWDKMVAVIELRAKLQEKVPLPPLDAADELLFGRELDVKAMHPRIREVYADSLKDLEEMDKGLDELLKLVAHTF